MDYVGPTLKSMLHTLKSVAPHSATIICPQKYQCDHPVEFVDHEIKGDYSHWILKNLKNFVSTDYCLVQQWDSAVLDESYWDASYFDYDYIGAPWSMDGPHRVGNGGFSLRSKKMLEESSKIADLLPQGQFITGNEDYFICVTARKYLEMKKIKFAPLEIARKFSVERPIAEYPHDYNDLSTYKSFGFHGGFNQAALNLINEE